ncbi:aquaporin [Arthrobacter sp. efr-133-TYG-104]|uniref:aquaporin n=1 Tax=Arthrobacter sp. efr-133-TYG-104 TaxID=3040324 RepID=UPI002551C08E|nr:aquaporin [Arthrobacter sp. efr-133-TYG-104]
MTTPVLDTADRSPGLLARASAEALGSMFVVLVAAGVAVFSTPASAPVPTALAAGLTVTAAMFAFGHVSGGHFNPVVTVGNFIAGRIRAVAALAYVVAQVVGSILGAALVYFVVLTVPVLTDARKAFDAAAPGFGEHSLAQTQMAGVLLVEVIGAALIVAVFLGSTVGRRALPSAAPIAVGLTMAVLLQFGQVLGNLPFNPARATAQAFFSDSWALGSLWLFWVAPIMGAVLAGLAFRGLRDASSAKAAKEASADAVVPSAEVARVENKNASDDEDSNVSERLDDEDLAETDSVESGTVATPTSRTQQTSTDEAREFFDGKRG